jgi:transcriptional regulator with XRE-family HTH domain
MIGEAERRHRFAYALQEAMAVQNMSGRRLAQALNVDPRKIARWLKEKDLPDLFEAQALAGALGVKEELFRNPPDPPPPPPKPYYPIEDYLLGAVDRGVRRGSRRRGPASRDPDVQPPQRPQRPS